MATFFISDLHLHPSRPDVTSLFLAFLAGPASSAEALYILGDLFEAWVGDDEDAPLAREVIAALARLMSAGVPLFLMRGNRDFLLGASFARESGARLLPDPSVILLYGEPTLLMHGDLLCSDDTAYLDFRRQVRNPEWQDGFLAQSLPARRAFADQARAASGERQGELRATGTLESITDVSQCTVEETMARYGVNRLIHGHTHRPAIHALRSGGRSAQRIVLGDWHENGSVLRVDGDGYALSELAFNAAT
jgi:UDP-2,3-diacylglucosamine hydrolase